MRRCSRDDAFGKDALAGLQVGAARERANVITTIPVDRAAPDLAAAVAAVNKARPSVVMVFLPPGPATKFIRTLKESGYTGAVASLSINGIPAVIRASVTRAVDSRCHAYCRVRMTRPTCWPG